MIALIFSFMMDYRVPVDYYYKEPVKLGILKPMNRKQRRKGSYPKGHLTMTRMIY